MTPEQITRAIVHNAADRAMSNLGFWVPLRVRIAIAAEVLAALAEHGLVVVRAEDIRAVLGPAPGVDAYIASGHRLLAAVEPSASNAPVRGSEPPPGEAATVSRVVGSADDPRTVGTPTALRERIADRLLAEDTESWGGGVFEGERTAALAAADVMLAVRDDALAEALRRADRAEAAVAWVRRLCELTIDVSIRVQAIDQARDTLAVLDVPADGEQTPTPETSEETDRG